MRLVLKPPTTAELAILSTLEVACALGLAPADGRPAVAAMLYAAQAIIALCLIVRVWSRDDRFAVVLILFTAAAIRVPAFASPPSLSNDAYRYVWDGELVLRGIDPHAATPLSPEAGQLRSTWLWPHIDYRTIPNVYPPLALALFAVGALDSRDLEGVKLVALGGDALVIAALFAVLSARRMPRGRVALYALHPLVAIEFAGNAHIEAWAIAGIVFAAASPAGGRMMRLAPLAIATAILTKIYPAVLAPIAFARNRVGLAITAGVVAIAYVPELFRGHALGSAANYLGAQRFNASLGALFGIAGELVIVSIVAAISYLYVRRGGDKTVAVLATIVAYLVSSPNVLPWYVLVLPALVCVVARPFQGALRALSLGIVGWSFTVAIAYGAPSVWRESQPFGILARVLEYVPLYAGLLGAALRARRNGGPRVVAA
jgi:hypothetical protein